MPLQIVSAYYEQVIEILQKEHDRYGKNSLAIPKYSLPIVTKLFLSK